jgi:hypothetical protein
MKRELKEALVVPHRVVMRWQKGEKPPRPGQLKPFGEIIFWFRCPHCKRVHKLREVDILPPAFHSVGRALRCGWVNIHMPWSKGRNY